MHNDDGIVGRLLSRRELVALFGSSAVAALTHRLAAQSGTSAPAAAAACVVQPQQTEGPYFVDERLLRSDIRPDPTTGVVREGAPLVLTLNISELRPDGTCAALPGAEVHLWQCDAIGEYSDVKDRNFDNTGKKFLRGHQITNASGAATFTTIYPGWYPGRAVHVHFKVRTPAATARAYEFTSQFYFDEAFTDRVYKAAPYAAHSGTRTPNERDNIYRDGGSQLILPVREAGKGYEAAFDVAMKAGDAPPAGRGRRGGG